jgi:glycosyltransferase involved in cell wall biosynthesis
MEKEHKNSLTVVIITKNEESEIDDCIKSLSFADEIVVVDSESTDDTAKIARKNGATIIIHPFKDFSNQREVGLKHAKGAWILYIDADERVPAELAQEIKASIVSDRFGSYKIPRRNFFYKKYEWPGYESMQRLFQKSELVGWHGKVHESPRTKTDKVGLLKNPILHYTHKDLSSMVEKTNKWSEIESELIFATNHPQMQSWRFVRIMLTKFAESFFKQGGWKMGTVGFIESIYQAYSYFIVYAKLWERQKNTNANN